MNGTAPVRPTVLLAMMRYRGPEYVAPALLDRVDANFVGIEPSIEILQNIGVPCTSFSDFITPKYADVLLPGATKRLEHIAACIYSDNFATSYPDIPPHALEKIRAHIVETCRLELLGRIVDIEALFHLASETDLRALVLSDDVLPGSRTLIHAAKRVGIPTLQVMHGIHCGPVTVCPDFSATYETVYSTHAKEVLIRAGADPERLVVTGNPGWDPLCRPPKYGLREALCQHYALNPGKPVVTYAMTDPGKWSSACAVRPRLHLDLLDAVLAAYRLVSERHPEWHFAIHPRPGVEPPSEVCKTIDSARENGIPGLFLEKFPPYESVVLSDVHLSTESNMGIEAILLGKPVINVRFDSICTTIYTEGFGPIYDDQDAVLRPQSIEELARCIESCVCDADVQQQLLARRAYSIERFNMCNDGKAAERVADLIVHLMHSRTKQHRGTPQRHPTYEALLLEAIPEKTQSVALVGGDSSRYMAAQLPHVRPGLPCALRSSPHDLKDTPVDTVVLVDPVTADAQGRARLEITRSYLRENATLLVVFTNAKAYSGIYDSIQCLPALPGYNGAYRDTGYDWTSLPVFLSSMDLTAECAYAVWEHRWPDGHGAPIEQADAWVFQLRPRPITPSPLFAERTVSIQRAKELNTRGEERFNRGDAKGACSAFLMAIRQYPEEALFYSNLAASYTALEEHEKAWESILEAFRLSPSLDSIRENLHILAKHLGREDEANRLLALFGSAHPPTM